MGLIYETIVKNYRYGDDNQFHIVTRLLHTIKIPILLGRTTMKKLLLIAMLGYSQLTFAAWTLDSTQSQLNFNTTKNDVVTETQRFTTLSGHVTDAGKADLVIALASVDTKITLRDERVRDWLFETKNYPAAVFTTTLDIKALENLAVGSSQTQTLKGSLQLHGQQKPIMAQVKITRLADKQVEVTSIEPVIVNAADFQLTEGIEKLRAVMMLNKITPQVPVSFRLVFTQ